MGSEDNVYTTHAIAIIRELEAEIEALEKVCDRQRNRAKDAEIEASAHKAENSNLRSILSDLLYLKDVAKEKFPEEYKTKKEIIWQKVRDILK